MQAKPLARPGPRPPISNTIFHSFGGTSLPVGALEREPRGQRSKPSHCWPQAALPRPSEARAQHVTGDEGVVGLTPLGPRSTGEPTKGLPQWLGTEWLSQQRDWENGHQIQLLDGLEHLHYKRNPEHSDTTSPEASPAGPRPLPQLPCLPRPSNMELSKPISSGLSHSGPNSYGSNNRCTFRISFCQKYY